MAKAREHDGRWRQGVTRFRFPMRTGRPWAAVLPVMLLSHAGCESPFKGEPQRPSESSGWEVDHSNATIPTQEEMDRQDEGFPDDD